VTSNSTKLSFIRGHYLYGVIDKEVFPRVTGTEQANNPIAKVSDLFLRKATKTLDAMCVLCEAGFAEDALILGRTIFELAVHLRTIASPDSLEQLGLDALRTLWRVTFRSSPPPGFTKDLMARFLCWHFQEQARSGLDPETALARGGKPGADRPRRLKPGTVLLREYQGERHTVTVVPNGYVWRETTYASLSTIARAITGTSWNGPRFFGLRSGAESTALPEAANVTPAPDNKRRLIRPAKSHPAGAAQNPLAGDGERRP
jgi:hypothetical protein